MNTAALDAPILKEIGETVRGLEALFADIGPLVSRLPANVPDAKAKPAAVKVHAFLKRHAPVTKIIASRIHDGTPPWVPTTLARIEKEIKIDGDRKKRTEALVKVMLLHMIRKMITQNLKDKPKT